MSQAFAADVLISGAGASGLTLALSLARSGVSFRLIEKLSEPFRGSRGKGIQPRTQEIFEDLGVLDRLHGSGGPYPVVRDHAPDGSFVDTPMMEASPPSSREPYTLPLMIPQFATERILRERLCELGHRVEFGSELVSFAQDENGVSARITSPHGEETVRVRYLVGADGGRSDVRRALGIEFAGKTLPVRAMVADVMLQGLSRDAWHRFNGKDMARQLAICPLAGTELFQLQGPVPLEGDVDLSLAGLSRMVAERTERADIRIASVSWASAFQMNARLAERYRVQRTFLVGDAAHVHPPTGGQGLNTSVQDAYNLGWKLAAVRAGAPESLLDSYEEERRPIAADMLGLSTKLLAAMKAGEMKRGREVQQLDLGYRGSSLALDRGRERALRAGDRAPDANVRGAAGQSVRLFQLFAGSHVTLLGFDVQRERVAPRAGLSAHVFAQAGDLRDHQAQVREAYDAGSGDWVLVRPDGYVGAFVDDHNLSELEDYLTRIGLSAKGGCHG